MPVRGVLAAVAIVAAACGSPVPPAAAPGSAVTLPPAASRAPTASASSAPASVVPEPSGGFVFDPESIVGYFRSIGYQCTERQPSATAAGYQFESCRLVDGEGRTRTLGLVSDPADNVADASFSVRAADGEAILDPSAVLEPFASFLGAFLGEGQGTELLPWLAAHLGDADARTTLGDLTIATYTDSPEDHSRLTVEIANEAFLLAPRPSASPG